MLASKYHSTHYHSLNASKHKSSHNAASRFGEDKPFTDSLVAHYRAFFKYRIMTPCAHIQIYHTVTGIMQSCFMFVASDKIYYVSFTKDLVSIV
jgi:hypothetical protein